MWGDEQFGGREGLHLGFVMPRCIPEQRDGCEVAFAPFLGCRQPKKCFFSSGDSVRRGKGVPRRFQGL